MAFELPVSENYESIIGYSEIYKRNVYRVVNRHTNVIEYETPMFGALKAVFKVIDAEEEEGNDEPEMSPASGNPMDFSDGRTLN